MYLTPFPGSDRKWVVSTGGGTQPRFSRSGRQMFYRDGPRMMAVDVDDSGGNIRLPAPRLLFSTDAAAGALVTIANYDATPSGDFVIMQTAPVPQHISVVLNWAQSLTTQVEHR